MHRLLSSMIAALTATACLPPAEDAGEVDPTGSDGTGGGAPGTGSNDESSGTDGVPADAAFDWSLELEPDVHVFSMIRTPNGVLLAAQSGLEGPEPHAEVREYSSSMELLWSQSLPNTIALDLEDLGGGEFLVTGMGNEAGTSEPKVWRVSCCSEPTSQVYPHPAENVWVIGADLRGDGLLLAVHVFVSPFELFGEATFHQVPLELGAATDLGTEALDLLQSARTPSGTVLLRYDCGTTTDCLAELGPDGVGGGYGIGQRMWLVGKGDELTLMSLLEDEVQIQQFGELEQLHDYEWVSVPTPGFAAHYDDFVVDRHERVVLVHVEDGPDETELYLVEFDDAGVVHRSMTIPHLQHAFASVGAVAVGEDDAIYVAVSEGDSEGASAGYLHRIAPL